MHLLPLALFAFLPTDIAALDEVDEARALQDVESTFPVVETTVPANGRIVFFGAPDPSVAFVRILGLDQGDGAEVELASETVAIDQFQSAHVVAVPEGLVAGEQLVIAARCPTCVFSGAWIVGDDDVTAPTFDDGPARVTADHFGGALGGTTGGYGITIELPPARDDRGAVTIDLRGDLAQLGPQVFAAGAPITIFTQTLDDSERTACFQAIAVDAAGNEAAFGGEGSELCVDLEHPFGGCAQTHPSTSLVAALFALVLVLRRRAVRP